MRNGAGTYNLPQAPFTPGTVISSTAVNSNFSDIANALTQSLANDGQTVPTANLPMGTYRHTGVGNAVARTDYAATGQVQDNAFAWCGTAGGTANALTLTPSPAISAYAAGQVFIFTAGASPNTGATTVAVSGLTAQAIQNAGAALTGGEIAAGRQYQILYNGTAFQLQPFASSTPGAGSVTNTMLAAMAANTVKANATAGSASPTDVSLAASRLLGRGSTGDISAITVSGLLGFTGADLAVSVASQAQQEAASSAVVAVTPSNQQWHPSALKGFCTVTISGGVPTLQTAGSYNVSSIGDNGVGDFTINWATAFSSANYALAGMAGDFNSGNALRGVMISSSTTISASAVRVHTSSGSGAAEDVTRFTVLAAGDR